MNEQGSLKQKNMRSGAKERAYNKHPTPLFPLPEWDALSIAIAPEAGLNLLIPLSVVSLY